MPRILILHVGEQAVEEVVSPVEFVAAGKHAERRMIAVIPDDPVIFAFEECVHILLSDGAGPVREFDLEIEAHAVRYPEGCVRWTPGVETYVVYAPFTADLELFFPAIFIERRVAGQREYAAVQCASEENSPPVDFEAAACGLELPEAEFDRF